MEIGRQINQGAGSTYNENTISNHLYYSADYQKLVSEIADTREILDSLPESKTELRLKHSGKLNDLEKQLTDFKQNVFSLYETFTKIPINTARLQLAKAHFDKGEFREADAILKTEEISNEVNQLKIAKEKKESELVEIEGHLENKANEFLIKAQLWKTFYSEPDWFDRTVDCYEKALEASRTVEVIFQYALFLQNHNKFYQAQPLYEEALKLRRELARENPHTYLPDVAKTLNNLAIIQKVKNEFDDSKNNYREALQIYRSLAKEDPGKYLPRVAATLNNLAELHSKKSEFGEAMEKYQEALQIQKSFDRENPGTYLSDVAATMNNLANLHKAKNEFDVALGKYVEALQIRRELAKKNPKTYLPDLAMTLNNLANLYADKNEFGEAYEKYEEALQIRRELARENPRTSLPDLAMTLNNLANLHAAKNEYDEALVKYDEALQIYRSLDKENPGAFLPYVATTVINLSIFYFKSLPDKEKSITLAMETLEIAKQFPDHYQLQQNAQKAIQVLQAHGVDTDKLMKNV